MLSCELPTRGPVLGAACQGLFRKVRLKRWQLSDVDRPERTANREKVLRIVNLLVAKELGPGTVRGIAETVSQLAGRVPSTRGLR